MSFLVSPGVEVNEIDLTNIIPALPTSIGGYAGRFNWGPVGELVTVGSEKELARYYGTPTAETVESFYTAASFLRYGNTLKVSRAIDDETAKNADSGDGTGNAVIKNLEDFDTVTRGENFYARYPGTMGNSLRVLVHSALAADTRFAISSVIINADDAADVTIEDPSKVIDNGAKVTIRNVTTDGDFVKDIEGEDLYAGDITEGIENSRTFTLYTDKTATTTFDGSNYSEENIVAGDDAYILAPIDSELFRQSFVNSPGTSVYARKYGVSDDEINVLVVDEGGKFTKNPGEILERFENLSVAPDAKGEDGSTIYYKDVINNSSRYILASKLNENIISNADSSISDSETTVSYSKGTDYTGSVYSVSLSGGVDTSVDNRDGVIEALDLFANADTVDVNLIFAENDNDDESKIARALIQLAEDRKDVLAFISPWMDTKDKGTLDAKLDRVLERFNGTSTSTALASTSYAVFDSSPLYVYDKYNDKYVWIPASGSMAGLCARTDDTNDPWWSPAGFTRGRFLGVTKLGFNPKQTHRDALYQGRVNPIVSFPGQGVVLYGDKTALARPSAFSRINVRRLFIVLEKSISTSAKFSLFEFNDEFTRAQFRNLVEPYLRDVRGRRGITNFLVVCDDTNNTGEVIDSNRFVADIYIKPARAINFITLNFIATRTSVEFSEVVGQF